MVGAQQGVAVGEQRRTDADELGGVEAGCGLQRPSTSLHSGWHTLEVEPGFEPGCAVLQTVP